MPTDGPESGVATPAPGMQGKDPSQVEDEAG